LRTAKTSRAEISAIGREPRAGKAKLINHSNFRIVDAAFLSRHFFSVSSPAMAAKGVCALFGLRGLGGFFHQQRVLPLRQRLPSCLSCVVDALWRIGCSEDATEVLGTKAKRGERRSVGEAEKSDRKTFAISLVAAAIRPKEDGGVGISLDDAFVEAGELFRLDEETVRTYWHDHPELRSPSFDRPITSLPNRARSQG
jgi:hypothetical protein